ncbi:MAG TPA: polysaccharide export protein, partial [Sphingorhabdus sp.]|nr:polysaccharide export protein [Sphingorhabdus sp.]
MKNGLKIKVMLALGASASALTGCGSIGGGPELPAAPTVSVREGPGEDYMIGPLDELTIFVW